MNAIVGVAQSTYVDDLKKVPAHRNRAPVLAYDGMERIGPHARRYIEQRWDRGIQFERTNGKVEVLVQVTPPASDILFGYDDVEAAAKAQMPGVGSLHSQWEDWSHQGEVFVRITKPLPCVVQVLQST